MRKSAKKKLVIKKGRLKKRDNFDIFLGVVKISYL